jgi:hypothetical protein
MRIAEAGSAGGAASDGGIGIDSDGGSKDGGVGGSGNDATTHGAAANALRTRSPRATTEGSMAGEATLPPLLLPGGRPHLGVSSPIGPAPVGASVGPFMGTSVGPFAGESGWGGVFSAVSLFVSTAVAERHVLTSVLPQRLQAALTAVVLLHLLAPPQHTTAQHGRPSRPHAASIAAAAAGGRAGRADVAESCLALPAYSADCAADILQAAAAVGALPGPALPTALEGTRHARASWAAAQGDAGLTAVGLEEEEEGAPADSGQQLQLARPAPAARSGALTAQAAAASAAERGAVLTALSCLLWGEPAPFSPASAATAAGSTAQYRNTARRHSILGRGNALGGGGSGSRGTPLRSSGRSRKSRPHLSCRGRLSVWQSDTRASLLCSDGRWRRRGRLWSCPDQPQWHSAAQRAAGVPVGIPLCGRCCHRQRRFPFRFPTQRLCGSCWGQRPRDPATSPGSSPQQRQPRRRKAALGVRGPAQPACQGGKGSLPAAFARAAGPVEALVSAAQSIAPARSMPQICFQRLLPTRS